jgi:hypothetical protein
MLGNNLATTFDSGIQDRFTGLTTNTVTLTHDISAETDILVVWNNIVQDSGTYSVGGTGNKTLTLGGTLVSADVVTVYYTNKVMQSVNPTAGSVNTNQLADLGVTGAKLNTDVISAQTALGATPADTDELLVSDAGVLKKVDYSYLKGEANTPSFGVRLSSDQTVANQTSTILALATEDWDTDSAWNTSNYSFTVPSNHAGKYFFYGHVRILSIWGHDSTLYFSQLYIRKNSSDIAGHRVIDYSATTKDLDLQVSAVLDLSVGDVINIRIYHNGAGQQNQNIASAASSTWFTGFKVSA